MLKEITLDDTIGKTITAIAISGGYSQAVIVFTDDTFTTLEVEHGYDGDANMVEGELNEDSILNFGDELLCSTGIVKIEEIEAIRKKRENESKLRQDRQERKLYEKLKLQFEGEE